MIQNETTTLELKHILHITTQTKLIKNKNLILSRNNLI